MITKDGYSKDPSVMPEGVVITFGQEMIKEQGGMRVFMRNFIETMDESEVGHYWMHKCTNLPKFDVDHIYIIIAGRLWGRVFNGGYKRDQPMNGFTADGKPKLIDWNYIVMSGPFERCRFKRELKGFQGFRYSTKLF